MLLVTHELAEAEALCDRVVAMRAGRVLDAGTPMSWSSEDPLHQVVVRRGTDLGLLGSLGLAEH